MVADPRSRNRERSRLIVAGLLTLAFSVLLVLLSWGADAPDSAGDHARQAAVDASGVGAGSYGEELGMLLDDLQAVSATDRGSQPMVESASVPSRVKVRSDCDWWEEARDSRRELHSILGFGPLAEGSLWRHPLLNREDRAPCKADRADLQQLLSKLVPLWERADGLAERVRLDEMAALVTAGGVREWVAPPMDERAIEKRARVVLAARERAGETASLDDIVRELRGSGLSRSPRESYVRIEGRYYLHSAFPELPRAREYREAQRMVAIECGSLIVAFFIQRGYTWWDEALERQLQSI